jgi:hypothetical protein
MVRPAAVGLLAMTLACGTSTTATAQDLESGRVDALPLNVRMTAPAGSFWKTPVQFEPPARGGILPSLYVGLIALQLYDGYSTSQGLENGGVESNALLRAYADNPTALWIVKGGATFASIYMAERLWRKNHRGHAIALMVVTTGLMAVAAFNNASVLRAQK